MCAGELGNRRIAAKVAFLVTRAASGERERSSLFRWQHHVPKVSNATFRQRTRCEKEKPTWKSLKLVGRVKGWAAGKPLEGSRCMAALDAESRPPPPGKRREQADAFTRSHCESSKAQWAGLPQPHNQLQGTLPKSALIVHATRKPSINAYHLEP